jgi:transcriptional regulator with PAS, ATPase and Fis domain
MIRDWIDYIKDGEMQKILQIASNVAPRRATVLITGESGVGKELMAQYIHQQSERRQNPFIAVNCAALPDNLLESELFGFEKGAFTGAHQSKPGKFELADKGTFLLDEISELPLALQGKLLRMIQESEVERLGGNTVKKVDVRLICTTNRSLADMVKQGQFRQDLFYRLNVIPLNIPPLRERASDLHSLVHLFLNKTAQDNNMEVKTISTEAMKKMSQWHWPGNIRELQNVIERSCLMSSHSILQESDIHIEAFESQSQSPDQPSIVTTGMTIQEAERRLILKTLELTDANRTQAAKILGISIRTLRNKLNEYKTEGELTL